MLTLQVTEQRSSQFRWAAAVEPRRLQLLNPPESMRVYSDGPMVRAVPRIAAVGSLHVVHLQAAHCSSLVYVGWQPFRARFDWRMESGVKRSGVVCDRWVSWCRVRLLRWSPCRVCLYRVEEMPHAIPHAKPVSMVSSSHSQSRWFTVSLGSTRQVHAIILQSGSFAESFSGASPPTSRTHASHPFTHLSIHRSIQPVRQDRPTDRQTDRQIDR